MVDLIPLVLVVLSVALALGVLILRWRRAGARTRGGDVVIGVASVMTLAGAYLAFGVIDGDPDVWDFYGSVWWVPLVIGGGIALVAAAIPRRDLARSTAVGSRGADARH